MRTDLFIALILAAIVISAVVALMWPSSVWPAAYKMKAYAPAPSMGDDRIPPTSFRDAKLKCVTGGC